MTQFIHRAIPNVHPGQRVITSAGAVRHVAFTDARGTIYVYEQGVPTPARVASDAWGGEASLELGGTMQRAARRRIGPHCGPSLPLAA